jgi:hypothetical protein
MRGFLNPSFLMKRSFGMWAQRFLICFSLAATTLSAYAFDRPFPPTAKRGTMSPSIYPTIIIDGKARNLSVSARIWNQDNLIEQPASLRGNGFTVNYTQTQEGEIDRVWILNSDEASLSLPSK